jgi:two-component system, NarL family, sensor histidine kinase BarA
MRILYLEDDPANLALIQRVAQMHSDQLITVSDPETAINELETGDFDLILTDVNLGSEVMDGLDFTAYLRENGITTPIVSITAYDFQEYARRSEQAGTDFHIVKPISVQDLINLLDHFRNR